MTVPQTQDAKVTSAAQRKPVLSPELREVLHMLKSLEAELDTRQASGR